jgi:hypothetical protein
MKPNEEDQKSLDKIRAAMPEDKKQAFDELCVEVEKVVTTIESGEMLTKNHYGKYLPFATTKLFVAVLLCYGANKDGVIAAAKLNGVKL